MRRAFFALSVLIVVLGVAPPASAGNHSPFADTDPVGDSVYARGDIDRILVTYDDPGQIKLDVGAVAGTTANSPVWNDPAGRTTIRWTLGLPGADRLVRMRATASGPVASLRTIDGHRLPCPVSISFLSSRRYRLSLASSCVDSETSGIRVSATFTYNALGPPPPDTDRYPDAGSTIGIQPD